MIVFKLGARRLKRVPGFLKLFLFAKLVCVFVCLCVSASWAIKNHSCGPTAFHFLFMTLAIDITDGWGLSNEARHKLLLKKSRVMLF